jgi:hypothetical protein
MPTKTHSMTASSTRLPWLFAAGVIACGLVSYGRLAEGEIIVGSGSNTASSSIGGASSAAQSARENRQRATVSRIEDGSTPNIVIIDGVVNGGWTGTASPAANSAAYDRVRANANRLNGDEVSATSQVIVAPVPGTTVHQPYTPAGQSAHENRQRANIYRERSE